MYTKHGSFVHGHPWTKPWTALASLSTTILCCFVTYYAMPFCHLLFYAVLLEKQHWSSCHGKHDARGCVFSWVQCWYNGEYFTLRQCLEIKARGCCSHVSLLKAYEVRVFNTILRPTSVTAVVCERNEPPQSCQFIHFNNANSIVCFAWKVGERDSKKSLVIKQTTLHGVIKITRNTCLQQPLAFISKHCVNMKYLGLYQQWTQAHFARVMLWC